MTTQTVKITNKVGLHARPASMLVNTAGKFECNIKIKNGDRCAAAKSMINLLTLRAKMNEETLLNYSRTAVFRPLPCLINKRWRFSQ